MSVEGMKRETPELLILAAGVGSRYGGLKQLDGIGPHQETIMDYSIYDAIQAGFKKIVFVINAQNKTVFESQIIPKFATSATFDFVSQDISHLPIGYSPKEKRTKPWGTGHAVWVARDKLNGPFAVINADDFYGRESFEIIAKELRHMTARSTEFTAVGYRLTNTLSDHGSVSRGICEVKDGFLSGVTERTRIKQMDTRVVFETDGELGELATDAIVSMNFWGLTPRVFDLLEADFKAFLDQPGLSESDEFFLPSSLDQAIKKGKARVNMKTTGSKWMGITYPEDRDSVEKGLEKLVSEGVYPHRL